MAHETILVFDLGQKEILNSNSIPSHFIVKGKMVSNLRELAAAEFLKRHPEEHQDAVREHLKWLRSAEEVALKKKRYKKRLLDKNKNLSKDELEAELEENFPVPPAPDVTIPPVHNQFTVKVIVYPPTRRRLDPPNLYPTVKPILDGGTDAKFWEDDDFSHVLEMSFRYGGLSGEAGRWKIKLIFSEVEDLSEYQLDAEHIVED